MKKKIKLSPLRRALRDRRVLVKGIRKALEEGGHQGYAWMWAPYLRDALEKIGKRYK